MKKRDPYPEITPSHYGYNTSESCAKETKKIPKLQLVLERLLKFANETDAIAASAESVERKLLGHNKIPLITTSSGGGSKAEPNVPCLLEQLESISYSLDSSVNRLHTVLNHILNEFE